MADTTKEKILKINTTGAEKNVKSLKQQIKELRDQMGQLEKGTAEYDALAKQLGETLQKQREISEATSKTTQDFGATLSNMTNVAQGVVGAISSINGVMVLMGADSEEAQEAMKRIHAFMAIIQGMGAIDNAVKALKRLQVAFGGVSKTRLENTASIKGVTAAEADESIALADNTIQTKLNNEQAEIYNEKQIENARNTDASTEAITRHTAVMEEASRLQKLFTETSNGHNVTIQNLNKRLAEGSLTFDEYARKIEGLSKSVKEQTWTLRDMSSVLKNAPTVRNADTNSLNTNTNATNANTTATNKNTGAKAKNTSTTNTNTASQKAGTAAMKQGAAATATTTKEVNGLTKAFKGMMRALPWLLAIGVALDLLTGMFGKTSKAEEEMKERLEEYQNMLKGINKTIEEGKVHVDVLMDRLNSSNSLSEKKAIIKELNKEITGFNGKVDETTKAVTYSEEALKKYNEQLEARTKLKAYESQLAELKAQRAEYELQMRIAQQSPLKKKEWDEAKKNLKQVDLMILQIENDIKKINLSDALTVDKKDNGSKTVVRTVKERLADVKALYKEVIDDITNMSDTKNMFNGVYDSLGSLKNKIYGLVKKSIGTRAGEAFTDSFKEAVANGFEDFDFYSMTVDNTFNREMVDKLVQELVAEEQTLAKYLNGQIKVSETVIKKQKEKVAALTEEVNTIKDLLNTVTALGEGQRKQALKAKEIEKWNVQYEQTKHLQEELMADTRSNNPYKEINQSILKATYSLENYKNELSDLDEEEKKLKSKGVDNGLIQPRLDEIAKRRREITLEQFKLESELEETMHQKRMLYLNEEHDGKLAKIKQEYDLKLWQEENHDLNWGQTDNYNSVVREVQNTIAMINAQIKAVEKYYKELQAEFEKNSVEWINLEIEKNATLEQLDREHAANTLLLEQETSKRRLNIAKTYISAYSALSNQIGSILSAQMERYDENSKEYKNLKYAQGVINTGEGVLAAFMSGIDSGIPAPWNLALAAAMAATTLTAGIMQLNNIKNEKVGGTMPTTTDLSSREYDTLTYAQGADTLSAIQDQRCYVVESDITSTQNRVQVAETQATF